MLKVRFEGGGVHFMSETEKIILEKLNEINSNMNEMRQDMNEMRQDMNEMRQGMNGMRQDMNEMRQDITDLKQRVTVIENKVTRIEMVIENEISKKIDIIGEGHDFLKQRLNDALKIEARLDEREHSA